MIIVTGAAGLIGGAVVRELNRRGREDLILTDHLGTEDKWMNLRTLRYAHYMEREELLPLLLGARPVIVADTIIHLGACSATTERDASFLMRNNYGYSVALAEYAQRHGARMVYASSAATYGDGEQGFDDSFETMERILPLNGYGYSKQAFDQYLYRRGSFGELLHGGDSYAGVKYFNVYGPNEYHKGSMRSLVIKAYYQIRDQGHISLFKSYRDDYRDGEQKRDFVYIDDAARMTTYLALDNRLASGLFNSGTGVACTWIELATAIFSAIDRQPDIRFIEMPEELRGRYQYYTCAPIDRIRSAGYREESTSLSDGVADYVRNYLAAGDKRA